MQQMAEHAREEVLQSNLKSIRKGTRSCVECRQRKIRCLWGSPANTVCTPCMQKNRNCVPQLYARRTANPSKASSRSRIARLEAQLADITAAVHQRSAVTPGQFDAISSGASSEVGDVDSERDDPTTTVGSQPPEHLRFLFDNALIGPNTRTKNHGGARVAPPVCSERYRAHARQKLQRLMPTRDDVMAISSYATPWMSLYYELFPSTSTTPSRDEMVNNHEYMLKPDAEPVRIATFLMSFAITALQVPQSEQTMVIQGWQDAIAYVKAVMTTVDAVIVSHSGIAATVDGISVIVLYLRLQLGTGQIRPLWLTLRRAVALAELIGLPRARHNARADDSLTPASENSAAVTDKVALWESIAATDRLASMMFNLPAATSAHHFPHKELIDATGNVRAQPYMFALAGIAMRIGEIDESYIDGKTIEDVYDNVITIDKELRALKSSTPTSWWEEPLQYLSAALLVQFWNYYITLRLHLHVAMAHDEHNIYAYSRSACLDACHAVAKRYSHVRRLLPPGFFICRIVDVQVFTAAVYLLLYLHSHNQYATPIEDSDPCLQSVERVIATMELVSKQVGSEFAREAAAALRALVIHFRTPVPHDDPGLSLRIPLLGSVHVGRRSREPPNHDQNMHPQPSSSFVMTMAPDQATIQEIIGSDAPLATNYQPWMQLDVNSSFNNAFFAEDVGGLDSWMSMGMTPTLDDVDMYNLAMGQL